MNIIRKILRLRLLFGVFLIILSIFFILWVNFMPEYIVERHGVSTPLYYAKILFISICGTAIITIFFASALYKDKLIPYINGLKRFMPLIKLMVDRDFKTRYKRSVFGVLWSLFSPLMTMIVMTVVFSYIFSRDIPNFPVYLLSGTLIFGFFSESTNASLNSIASNRAIISKVYVPKYIFPLTKVFLALVNLGFSLISFAIVFIATKAPLYWTVILIPIPLIYTFTFALGMSMLISCIAVFFRDIQYLYSIFITALTYLTPLFYPVTILPPRVLTFMGMNPMYHFVSYFRSLVLYGEIPGLWSNVVCISFALFFLFAGTLVFMANQDKFILHI